MALFDTAEYLRLEPWVALIKIINDEAYLQLEPYQTKLVSFEALGNQIVKVVVDANRSTSNQNILLPLEPQTFWYTRLILDKYFEFITLTDIPLPFSTYDLMLKIGELKDIAFDLDDVIHEDYADYPTEPVVITANPKSLRWEGSFKVMVENTLKKDLFVLNNTEVPEALAYPNNDPTKAQGYFYLNPFDFSEYRQELIPLGFYEHTLDGEKLAAIITKLSGQEWVCSKEPHPRNIAYEVIDDQPYYKVVYHGPSIERYTARTDLPRVIVLDINENLCTSLAGAVRLHYT